MKIKISRSFSKRIQLKQFEPIESSCTVEAETEVDIQKDSPRQMIELSEQLAAICNQEVEKTLNKFKSIDT